MEAIFVVACDMIEHPVEKRPLTDFDKYPLKKNLHAV